MYEKVRVSVHRPSQLKAFFGPLKQLNYSSIRVLLSLSNLPKMSELDCNFQTKCSIT